MSNFKDRLWRDLIREHGAMLNEENETPAKGAPWLRPRLLFGGGLAGAAGVGTAVAIALGTAGTSPAFAVTPNHDGSYTVELYRASGITGLNTRLAQLGVAARAVAVQCYIGSGPPPSPERTSWTVSRARIQPDQIPPGKWLELPATTSGGKGAAAANFVAKGASCDSVPPPCPPGPETIAVGPNGTTTTTMGTSTTDTGTSTTGTATSTSSAGGSGIAAQAPVPMSVLVPARGCGVPWTSTAGPGTRTNWTGTSTSQRGTSTGQTGTSTSQGGTSTGQMRSSTAAAPTTKAGS